MGTLQFLWQIKEDICWVPLQNILTRIPVSSASSTGRSYKIEQQTAKEIEEAFEKRIK